MSARRTKVLLFLAASVIAVLSGALAGALTLERPAVEAATVDPCVDSACVVPTPSPSSAPTVPCDVDDVACTGDVAFEDDEDVDEEDWDDGDNSGPGSDSSGPG